MDFYSEASSRPFTHAGSQGRKLSKQLICSALRPESLQASPICGIIVVKGADHLGNVGKRTVAVSAAWGYRQKLRSLVLWIHSFR